MTKEQEGMESNIWVGGGVGGGGGGVGKGTKRGICLRYPCSPNDVRPSVGVLEGGLKGRW